MEVTIILAAKIIALLFTVSLGVVLIISMRKDGKLTADEASKVVLMGLLIYMTIMNGTRATEWLTFDQGTYLIVLGSVLALAGIDIYRAKGLLSGKDDKDNKDKN